MKDFPNPLLFVRHGATNWNLQQRYQGTRDTSLSGQGVEDALENARLLRAMVERYRLDSRHLTIACSPLQRATDTANILAQCFQPTLPIVTVDVFRELSMGRWEGLTSAQVKQRYYEERKLRKLDRWNFAPQGGESMAERSEGIKMALRELPPYTVIVTHCVVLRIIFHLLEGADPQVAAVRETPHTSIWCWNSVKLHRQA